MKNELSLDNILGEEDVNSLFSEVPKVPTESNEKPAEETKEETAEVKENPEQQVNTAEINESDLFDEKKSDPDKSESVGSGNSNSVKEKEDTTSKETGTSPTKDFYSSIANAAKEDGIFQNLNEDDIKNIKGADGFRTALEKEVSSRLDERQKRVDEALNAGVETSDVQKYESVIAYLNGLKEEDVISETPDGEDLRKRLIYNDFINRGFSQERATKEVSKSIEAGTDVDDAKQALEGTKDFYSKAYNEIIDNAKAAEEERQNSIKKEVEAMKKSILEEDLLKDVQVDKATRQKAYDNISKPIYKDPKTGMTYTAIQKYEAENNKEFLAKLAIIYTLTDGFKDISGLTKTAVKKEVKKGFKELEHTINSTSRNSDGSLNFVSGVSSDPESYSGTKITLDIPVQRTF